MFASFRSRALAVVLDTLSQIFLSAPASIVFGALGVWIAFTGQDKPLNSVEGTQFEGNVAFGAVAGAFVALVLVSFAYQLMMTARGGGWGKRMLGIRIVRADNGEDPGYSRALRRIAARAAFSVVPLLDHLWMLWDPYKQTWHDKAAGTYVVQRQR